jgi:hypothetical protein
MGMFLMIGNAIISALVFMTNVDVFVVSVSGCGWNIHMTTITATGFSSNGCSIAVNTVTIEDVDITHSDTVNPMIYARYSEVTIG